MELAISILIPLLLLSIPLLLGPLRNGIRHVLFSILFIIVYIIAIFFLGNELRYLTGVFLNFELIIGVIIIAPIVIATVCYFAEKGIVDIDSENFYDERLFYKYGLQVRKEVIPLGIGEDGDNSQLIEELYEHLKSDLSVKFSQDELFSNQIIEVNDSKNKTDTRFFIKLSFETIRKSIFFNFINLKKIGGQIAVNNIQYVKSRHKWYHVFLFIVTAPFHYWRWIYHRLGNKYSIDSYLGNFYYGNSFDIIDLESYVKSSTFITLKSIEDFAKSKGLLTEKLKQQIVNNINNTQNIHIKKSSGVRVGKLSISNASK